MDVSTEKHGYKDSGFAWVILLSTFCMRILDSSAVVTMGIFIIEYLEYFHLDKALTVTAFISCYFVAMAFSGPVCGLLMRRFGVRPVAAMGAITNIMMFLIAGSFPSIYVLGICYFFIGWGFQATGTGTVITVQTYFDKKRSLASGILMSGLACGEFIWPPLIRIIIDCYTWRGALYILAGVAAQLLVFISILRPPPKYNTQQAQRTEKHLEVKVNTKKLKYFTWVFYLICVICQFMGYFIPMNYFPMKGHEEGIDKHRIPILVSVIGGMGLFMRPFAGFVGDRFFNRMIMAIVSLLLCGTSLICIASVRTFTPFLVIAIFIGIFQSFFMGTINAQWVDIFGIENVAIGSGFGAFSIGISVAILHPIAGALKDLTGSTEILFLAFGGIQIVSSIMLLIVKLLLRYEKKLSSPELDNKLVVS